MEVKMSNDRSLHLSDRLTAICSMITEGNRLCDVGCDHAWVPISLLQQGKIPGALAMDVVQGPLQMAEANVAAYGYSQSIELRQSDGLDAYEKGQADTLLIAGMGGVLITRILEKDREKTRDFKEIILEPQSETAEVRRALRRLHLRLTKEDMVEEDGKFYPILRAVPAEDREQTEAAADYYRKETQVDLPQEVTDEFGPFLLQYRHPALLSYLHWRRDICQTVVRQLRGAILKMTGQDPLQTETLPDSGAFAETVTAQGSQHTADQSGAVTAQSSTIAAKEDAAGKEQLKRLYSRWNEIIKEMNSIRRALAVYGE